MTTTETQEFDSGGLTLVGTLARPALPATSAVVLLVPGSGPINRDSDMKRAPLGITRLLADALSQAGIASFRYDKRGVGESDGDYNAAGFTDNIDDARAAVEHLHRSPSVGADRVVVMGHSEGALIATALAGERASIDGAVLLAGAAQTGEQVLKWQARMVGEHLPTPVQLLLKLLRTDIAKSQEKRLAKIAASTEDVVRVQGLVKLNARWFREFMVFDPAPALQAAAIPMLAVTGADDIQVNPDDVARIEQLTSAPFEGHVVPGVNHILRTGGPNPNTYKKQTRDPIAGEVVDLVSAWLTANFTP